MSRTLRLWVWAGAGRVRTTVSVADNRPFARFRSTLPEAPSLSPIATVAPAEIVKAGCDRGDIGGLRPSFVGLDHPHRLLAEGNAATWGEHVTDEEYNAASLR